MDSYDPSLIETQMNYNGDRVVVTLYNWDPNSWVMETFSITFNISSHKCNGFFTTLGLFRCSETEKSLGNQEQKTSYCIYH